MEMVRIFQTGPRYTKCQGKAKAEARQIRRKMCTGSFPGLPEEPFAPEAATCLRAYFLGCPSMKMPKVASRLGRTVIMRPLVS